MVEWKKLGDVANLIRGKVISKDFIRDNEGEYPVYSSQTANEGIFGCIDSYMFDGDYLTWTTDGAYAGTIFRRKGKFNITNVCGLIDITSHDVDQDFLYYWLSLTAKDYVIEGMGNPKLMSNVASTIKTPILPLPEQQRIVGILDTFTSSIENLKEQIAQRRKQYEYYRCRLLSSEKWKEIRIGELTKVFSCPRVFKDQWQDSGVPFWRSSDVMSYHNGVVNPRGEVFISESLYEELSSKSEKIKEGDVLVTGGGSIGIPYLKRDDSPLFVKDADLICIQKCSMIIPKFLYHYLLSTDFKLYLKKITHDATIAHYTINQIKDTPVPLPSISEQNRIVSILDTFEASVANLEQQLALREKQYEYYRNKLLTFE